MPVDKFGRMSDTKTNDTGVSLTYIDNNYIRSDGTTPVSGSIDMRGNTLYNVSDPVNPQDLATKEYADQVGGGSPFLKENGNYKVMHTIDMNYNKLLNLHKPTKPYDAATKDYVDYADNVRTHIIAVHARYCGLLKKGEYQFNFSGGNFKTCEEVVEEYKDFKGSTTGFLIPHSGRIKKIVVETLFFMNFLEFIQEVEEELVNIGLVDEEERINFKEAAEKGKEELKKKRKKKINFSPNNHSEKIFKIVKFEKKIK